ncbi:3'-5' RNA helicase ythdc2 [Parelaphostrongylus tenuis]|uniref:3'-5' RNA helicase ythdc2 n=1 Tax=Parelaphostrongylus tenuis TaxID=148309 RepID=A0AAD5MSP5_PARTN|nr:3'-5' RNA helicase ythdc2 [Parelaphostrongylus tenuis]
MLGSRGDARRCPDLQGSMVFNEFNHKSSKQASKFCAENYLSVQAKKPIARIRRQLLHELRRVGMIICEGHVMNAVHDATYNCYSSCWQMVQAAIVAGCFPGIGFAQDGRKLKKIKQGCSQDKSQLIAALNKLRTNIQNFDENNSL